MKIISTSSLALFLFAKKVDAFTPFVWASTPTKAFMIASTATAPQIDAATKQVDDGESGAGLAQFVPDFQGQNKDLLIKMENMLRDAQISITSAIQDIDGGAVFHEDAWVRETGGGGGFSRVLAGGKVWEKAGVNLSVVHGNMPASALRAATTNQASSSLGSKDSVKFSACGLSCVMHPRNPHCPTMHFNYRLFQTEGGNWWFGGGTDITPSYLDEDDVKQFHAVYKDVCDRHDPNFYRTFKAWADEYFFIPHRGERRGLGGIFFDDLNDRDPERLFDFCKDAVNHVVDAYAPIIQKHRDDAYTAEEKRWQQLRRGRYVEFNLVYDRGTTFGLKTNGRVESILMSLPETARWEYDHHPEAGTPEAVFLDACVNPRDWV